MFKPVPTQVDFVSQERQILDLWREIAAFEKLRRKNRGREKFSFIDGPI
jgi:isoleucyl-tRNA synthetase